MTPTAWAKKQNKPEILTLLLESGGAPLGAPAGRANQNRKVKPVAAPEPKPVLNERKIPKRYMLTKLREGGFYSPMTDQEFEEFKR